MRLGSALRRARCWGAVFLAASCLSCSDPAPRPPAAEYGKQLFHDPQAFGSSSNRYACSTCHDTDASAPTAAKKTGAALAGVTRRPTFWNGQENDLLRAINACLHYFMAESTLFTSDDERARALYAFLESIEPGDANPVPFHLIRTIENVPRGDAMSGEALYLRSCWSCHGSVKTGIGRLTDKAPILPDQTIAEHADYSPRLLRLVFLEKTRHGAFFGYGGTMPPFSRETLSDVELGAILEYLGVTGE